MIEKKRFYFTARKTTIFLLLLALTECQTRSYVASDIRGEYIPVTPTQNPDQATATFINSYKQQLDDQMNEVIGHSVEFMPYSKPESLLTNLTSDVMVKLDPGYTGGVVPDLSLMNVSGHRAALPKGDLTVGHLFSTYSFENQLAVVRLKGEYLHEVFDAYAQMGGAGISSTVKCVIKDNKVVSALVNGEPVDNNRIYTIITLDYLAEGNSRMSALTQSEETTFPGITLRDYMIKYIKNETRNGREIRSVLDGRITIE
ncbi:MAG: 5'-nucleotidase C-terminal domain-containing protein [Bacteroides sp.]|nr:5'-nucleotidase C-terminal domain-containing protein [Bacteroides sp.]